MTEFSQKEIEFLKKLEEARIATSHDDIPHVKPVSFVFEDNAIIVATDYNTRTYTNIHEHTRTYTNIHEHTRTYTNIKSNSQTSIVIDVYKSGEHKAVCIQGKAKIIERGLEFKKLYSIFYNKLAWVRKDPWKENEAPFLKIIPINKISWGLN